jgi:hypothetical protein
MSYLPTAEFIHEATEFLKSSTNLSAIQDIECGIPQEYVAAVAAEGLYSFLSLS